MQIFGHPKSETRVDPVTGTVVTKTASPAAVEKARADLRVKEAAERARKQGYESGRRDGAAAVRASRRGHPVLATVIGLVALAGVVGVALAVHEGSFSGAGRVVDAKVAAVTTPARDAVRDAADKSGNAVANAGQAIEQQGQKLRQSVD